MRGLVYNNGVLAGYLERHPGGTYSFRYEDVYFNDPGKVPVSLSLPKSQQEYHSGQLFAFFYGLLSEGVNKDIQCRLLKIDERDHFLRLLATAADDTIGAITVKPEDHELFQLLYRS